MSTPKRHLSSPCNPRLAQGLSELVLVLSVVSRTRYFRVYSCLTAPVCRTLEGLNRTRSARGLKPLRCGQTTCKLHPEEAWSQARTPKDGLHSRCGPGT